jgi:hypothetical protein
VTNQFSNFLKKENHLFRTFNDLLPILDRLEIMIDSNESGLDTMEESWIPRSDFVAKTLAGLTDAERWLLARSVHHVLVVHKDALRGSAKGNQIVFCFC